jgi:hypothetical protein
MLMDLAGWWSCTVVVWDSALIPAASDAEVRAALARKSLRENFIEDLGKLLNSKGKFYAKSGEHCGTT